MEDALLDELGGGRESSNDAPNEEVGLNCLSPANPVICGCRGTEMEGGLVGAVVDVVFVPVDMLNERLENAFDKSEVVVVEVN